MDDNQIEQPSCSKTKTEIPETDNIKNENCTERTTMLKEQAEAYSQESKQKLVDNEDDTKPEEKPEIKYFKCYLCNLEEQYDYYGKEPSFMKKFVMQENCYMIEDPFVASRKGEFFTIGADCSICNRTVCKDAECSFYYLKTYCVKCLKEREKDFPQFLHEKIKKILRL